MSSAKGLVRVYIKEVSSEHYKGKQVFIRVTMNNVTYKVPAQNVSKVAPRFVPRGQNLELSIFSNEQTDTRRGYFKLPMGKLYEQPKKNHIVQIDCVWRQRQDDSIEQGPSAFVTLSLVYFQNPLVRIQLNIKEACLIRDTQQIGNMDPFCQVSLGLVTLQTSVKEQAGKNPVWNENLLFDLDNTYPEFKIVVKDKDMVNDDIIGIVDLNPFQQQLYVAGKDKIAELRQFDIQLNDQKVGTIKVGFLFSVIDS